MTVYVEMPRVYTGFHFDGSNLSELQQWAHTYEAGQFETAQIGTHLYLFHLVTENNYPLTNKVDKYWQVDPGWGVTVRAEVRVQHTEGGWDQEGNPIPGGQKWVFVRLLDSNFEFPNGTIAYDTIYQPIPNLEN